MTKAKTLDPITIQVIRNALVSAANEMTETLIRTSFNPVLYEMLDFCADLFNEEGDLIAEGKGAVIFMGTVSMGIRNVVAHVGKENIDEGDVFATCYSYLAGSHHPDVLIMKPVFHQHEIFAWAATKAHWADTGAYTSYGSYFTDMYQEGLILPGVKLVKKGVLDKDIVDIIRFNSRLPESTIGDMTGQLAACETGEKRILGLIKRYGKGYLKQAINAILDQDEQVMRKAISEIPDGDYYAENWMDDNGLDDIPLKICVTISVKGDEITFNTAGSPPVQPGATNTPLPSTNAMARLVTKMILDPHTRSSEGSWRPVKVVAPERSIFNPRPPASTKLYSNAAIAMGEAIFKALADAVPEKVVASSGGDLCPGFGFYGVNPRNGKYFAGVPGQGPVGQGASFDRDGGDATIHFIMSGSEAIPVEICEERYPFLVERFSLRDDSCGPGKFRGGLGIERWVTAQATGRIGGNIERTKSKPWGLFGGKNGMSNLGLLYVGQENERTWGKLTALPFKKGEKLKMITGGGGGWGNPLEREPNMVLDDVIRQYVSIESAKNDYGVVIKVENEEYVIDMPATQKLRKKKIQKENNP